MLYTVVLYLVLSGYSTKVKSKYLEFCDEIFKKVSCSGTKKVEYNSDNS